MGDYAKCMVVNIKSKSSTHNNSFGVKDLKIDTSKYRENKAYIKKSIPLKI